jgi:hypothetical protein
MAVLSTFEFRQLVEKNCSDSNIVMKIQIISETTKQIRMRIFLSNRTFLDVYYNLKNEKTAFAQIKENKRIFGADNTTGTWHWHPYKNPEKHNFVKDKIAFSEFLKKVEENINE